MRAVVQRVVRAAVRVEGAVVGEIGFGLMVLVGVARDDSEADAEYIADKVAHLRIFPDAAGRMELSALESGGQLLVVSQFTLHGDVRKGRRPSYTQAAAGAAAVGLYEAVCDSLRRRGLVVETGRFGAEMEIEMTCAGPVTILLESKRQF